MKKNKIQVIKVIQINDIFKKNIRTKYYLFGIFLDMRKEEMIIK